VTPLPQGEKRMESATRMQDFMKKEGVGRYFGLDVEGNKLCTVDYSESVTHVLTAMFATILTAAETAFYELDMTGDIRVNMETEGQRPFVIIKLGEEVIIVVETDKKEEELATFIGKLKKMVTCCLTEDCEG